MNSFIPSLELAEKIAKSNGTPAFVTSADHLRRQAKALLNAFTWPKQKIFYAIKANYNPAIIKILRESGIEGIDAVSVNEVRYALSLGYPPQNIIFTGSNPATTEIEFIGKHNILFNAGSLSEIERFGIRFPGKKIAIRLNPDIGAGEHQKVITGVADSKFGIHADHFADTKQLLEKYQLQLVGVHCHIGSGFYDPIVFAAAVKYILNLAADFPMLDFVDFGGGFGIHYQPDKTPIDLAEFGSQTNSLLEKFSQQNDRQIEMRLEPGKYLVGESTCLLARVTTVKQNGPVRFVGLDTGFHHLVRPVMYDSYHHIVNLSNPNGESVLSSVVGNICESGDIFAHQRHIPESREGDLIAILTTGAYGSSMSSNYNLHPLAAEVLVEKNQFQLTRKRQTFEQIIDNYLPIN